jgi:uncharacterized protein YkwD
MSDVWRTVAGAALIAAATFVCPPAFAQDEALAELALTLVNEARSDRGLDPLETGDAAATAAQAYAERMLEEEFYGHIAPDGGTVRDRYLAAGGSTAHVIAENLARCAGCNAPADAARVRAFHDGWMQSPGHRENILAPGLDRFGFGLAGADDRILAVQVFAGPGTAPGGDAQPAAPDELRATALDAVRAALGDDGASVEASPDLHAAAETIAAETRLSAETLDLAPDPFTALPEGSTGWTALSVAAQACSGCGAVATRGDAERLAPGLLPERDAGDLNRFGFALRADGDGRKIAVGVWGRR